MSKKPIQNLSIYSENLVMIDLVQKSITIQNNKSHNIDLEEEGYDLSFINIAINTSTNFEIIELESLSIEASQSLVC